MAPATGLDIFQTKPAVLLQWLRGHQHIPISDISISDISTDFALASLEEILQQPKNKFIVAGTVQNFAVSKLEAQHKCFGLLFKKRNLTVHTYNQNVAKEVYQAALIFPLAVKTLIIKLSVKP